MGALATIRADLKMALEAAAVVDHDGEAVKVLDKLPDAFQPPALMIVRAAPFITPTGPYGIGDVRYDIRVIVGPATNEVSDERVEALVEQVVDAVYASGHDWLLVSVSDLETVAFGEGGPTFLAVRVTVTRPATFTTA